MNRYLIKYYLQKFRNYLWHLPLSILINLWYGFPQKKLILIGITGTDGKTTTSTLIHQSLLKAGIKADLITTINSPGLHTTSPHPSVLVPWFKRMVQQGTTHVVVETTAHGLDQFRFWGCHFKVGVLTNIAPEHLDDFIDLSRLINAKAKLFHQSSIAILNHDDPSFNRISSKINCQIKTYGITQPSDYQAINISRTPQKLTFNIKTAKLSTNSSYDYQIYNILAGYAAIDSLNIPPSVVINTIKKFPETKGRREVIKNNLGIKTIIDFAHTPQALKATLTSLRADTKGKLIVIFGATGGRDPFKRPLMGRVVSEISDIAIITSDDTRNESIDSINQQIIKGINKKKLQSNQFKYFNIPNRQDAFNRAIKLSSPGDTIVACGKGHETTILLGNTEYPWSEAEAFRAAFRNKLQNNNV